MNNSSTQDDEIILSDLLKVIWVKKIQIFLILLISVIISSIYINQQPNNIKITLEVKKAKNSEFVKLLPLNDILKEYIGNDDRSFQENIKTKNSSLQNYFYYRFIDEVLDYEELTTVLKENNFIKNKLSQSKKDEDINSILFGYAKSLGFEDNGNEGSGNLVVYWHDIKEAQTILNDTLVLAKRNLKKTFINEMNSYLKVKKLSSISNDLDRIDYLTEQREIALQLGYKKNQLNSNTNIVIEDENSIEYYRAFPEYFKGHEVIDLEINHIKNRNYRNFDNIQKEINDLNNYEIKFADYNMFLAEVVSVKQTKSIFILSIVIGLIIALFYAFISNNFTSKLK